LKAVAGSAPGATGSDPKMRAGPGAAPSRSLGMAAMRALISASRGSLKSAASAVLGKRVTLPVSLRSMAETPSWQTPSA
jgi:hypothetical protein